MARLYSYCLKYDDGAAPNPYWDVCTLVICKPRIRASAKEGDWIAGTGAKFARVGDGTTRDLTGRLVYAMKVTRKMTMCEYDEYTRRELTQKIPVGSDSDRQNPLGDSIYDYGHDCGDEHPSQRPGVHVPGNAATDLRGKHALLSTHFYYFGANAIQLPGHLRDIAQNQQGHRVNLNDAYVDRFILWLEGLGHKPGVLGKPLLDLFATRGCQEWCAAGTCEEDDNDVEDVVPVSDH